MKLSNSTIFDGIVTLRSVRETGRIGYACARNLRKLTDACKEFMDVRDELLNKYGKREENGNFTIQKENIEAFQKELNEYAVIEHEVDIMQVDEDTFCSGSLDSKAMYDLWWMVKE